MEPSSSRRTWILPLLLVAVLVGVLAVRAWQPAGTRVEPTTTVPMEGTTQQQVALTIDTGDRPPRASSVPWQAGMTVQEMLAASDTPFVVHGNGPAAFLTELAGIKNEGPGGRNWQFEVNGKWSDRSFGIQTLEPGDHVLWKFAASE